MRRIILSLGIAAFLTGLVFLAMGVASTPERHAPALSTSAPSPTNTLPACAVEDGSGQALCMWDAQEQGNGRGTSVVSGDCAPSVMGEDSALCVQVHARDSVVVGNGDGSSHIIPNGADIVGECATIAQQREAMHILDSDGWTMRECLSAW